MVAFNKTFLKFVLGFFGIITAAIFVLLLTGVYDYSMEVEATLVEED